MPPSFDRLFDHHRLVVLDGATGTLLQQFGMPLSHSPESWVLENPVAVYTAAEAYVNAGSDIILTCTFGGTVARLQESLLGDRAFEINQTAAKIAREATHGRALVAGSIGPLGRLQLTLGGMRYTEAVDQFAAQAQALVMGGVDLFEIESFSDLQEIQAAVEGVRQVSKLPIFATMSFDSQGKTLTGITPYAAAKMLAQLDVTAIGANCGRGPWDMAGIMREMVEAVPGMLLVAKPNAGLPEMVDGKPSYPVDPAKFAQFARDWIRAGARIVGGCCGSTPKHIEAIRAEISGKRPVSSKQ
ncbi:MAG: homocysteine S-methyltransferase family protein [Chloroflexi bacterium]|nr:homocysteine S-methyltransferase family protein [Chloroflexota bacterium]